MIEENIENLKSHWRNAGQKYQAYKKGVYFDVSEVSFSEWPNRLWFHQDITEESLREAKKRIISSPTKLIIPYWNIYERDSSFLLEANEFVKVFEQVGMSLALSDKFDVSNELVIKKVSGIDTAMIWEGLFKKAFGYLIDHRLIMQQDDTTSYWIAYANEIPTGTFCLHNNSQRTIGIHAMGIIPEMRRKGFAEELMRKILNQSLEKGFIRASLQASVMGRGIYEKLGFKAMFNMKNYALVRKNELN